jgi:hypothetical protein
MAAQEHVEAVLKLLAGMQAGHVMATSVKVDDNGVELQGIGTWDPIQVHDNKGWDGNGEPP